MSTSSSPKQAKAPPAAAAELIGQCAGLLQLQRQTVDALAGSLDEMMAVQSHAFETSGKCRQLADSIVRHGRHTCDVIGNFDVIESNGQAVRMTDVTGQAETLLGEMAGEIVNIARNVMHMVFQVHDMNRELDEVHNLVRQMHGIQWQSRMMTLNARAAHDTDGQHRLADELQDMSREMADILTRLDERLDTARDGFAGHADKLAHLAATDVDTFIDARIQISHLNAMLQNHAGQSRSALELLQQSIASQQSAIERLAPPAEMEPQPQALQHASQLISALGIIGDLSRVLEMQCNEQATAIITPIDLLERISLPVEERRRLAELLVDNVRYPNSTITA